MRTMIVVLTATLAATSPAAAQNKGTSDGISQWPAECHALSRIESLLKADRKIPDRVSAKLTKFETIRKFDVVCISNTLRLDKPIYTNGGDVLIYADDIELSSEINTRIATAYSVDDRFLDPDAEFPVKSPDVVAGFVNAIEAMRASSFHRFVLLSKSYEAYYNCLDCLTSKSGQVFTFSRPSGFTPAYYSWVVGPVQVAHGIRKYDGISAPTEPFAEDADTPGNVVLFARNIAIKPGASINAAGATGGTGGAGEPPNCILEIQGVSCNDNLTVPGPATNSNGGKGGNGGGIYVYTLDDANASPIDRDSIIAVSRVSGGAGGANTKKRSPQFTAKPTSGSAGDFETLPESWPLNESGRDGTISFTSTDASSQLKHFLDEVAIRDALRIYDLQELASRADLDESISSISLTDYVTSVGYRLLTNTQAQLASLAKVTLADKSTAPQIVVPSFICPPSFENSSVNQEIYILLTRSKPYCGAERLLLESFLDATGGLLRIYNLDPTLTGKLDAIYREQVGASVDLKQIQVALVRAEESLIGIYASVERHRMEAQISSLKQELKDVEAAIEARKDKSGDQLGNVVALAGAVYGAGGAATQLYQLLASTDQPATTSAGRNKFKESSRDLVKSISEIRLNSRKLLVRQSSDGGLQQQQEELSSALNDLDGAIDGFIAEQQVTKERAQAQLAAKLLAALHARSYRQRTARLLAGSFEDLFKLSLISYYSDISRRVDELKFNLSSLDLMMRAPRQGLLDTQLNRQLPACDRNLKEATFGGCITLVADGPARVYLDNQPGPTDYGATGESILLYRVPAGRVGQILESYGVGPVSISAR